MTTVLKCPSCGNTNRFCITAMTSVYVRGESYLKVEEECRDRGYSETSKCACDSCGESGVLKAFMVEQTMEQAIAALKATYVEQHPDYPASLWREDVAGEGTVLGYWEWVQHRLDE